MVAQTRVAGTVPFLRFFILVGSGSILGYFDKFGKDAVAGPAKGSAPSDFRSTLLAFSNFAHLMSYNFDLTHRSRELIYSHEIFLEDGLAQIAKETSCTREA